MRNGTVGPAYLLCEESLQRIKLFLNRAQFGDFESDARAVGDNRFNYCNVDGSDYLRVQAPCTLCDARQLLVDIFVNYLSIIT